MANGFSGGQCSWQSPLRVVMMSIGQEFLPTPNMVSQTYRHRRTFVSVTTPVGKVICRFSQSPMRAQPIVPKQAQDHKSIPCILPLGKSMGLSAQTLQPITQYTVQAFYMDCIRTIYGLSQHLPNLDTHHFATTTMLEGLGQPNPSCRHQARSSPFAKTLPIPIHTPNLSPIYLSSVTNP